MSRSRNNWICRFARLGCAVAALLAGLTMVGAQGLPEPGVVFYGSVTNGASGAGLTSGTVSFTFTNGANTVTVSSPITNVGGKFLYVVEVPFETVAGGLTASPTTALPLPGTTASFGRSAKVDGTNAVILDGAGVSFPMGNADRGRQLRVNLQVTRSGSGETYEVWSTRFFGVPNADPNADPDGDGRTNLQEYQEGTNPTDANSVAHLPPEILRLNPTNNYWVARTNLVGPTSASFTVVANGASAYQWSFSGTPITGATNATLLLNDVRRTNSGVYSVIVSGPGGTVGTNTLLHVAVPQRIRAVQRMADGTVRIFFNDEDGIVPSDTSRLIVQATEVLRKPETTIVWTNLTGTLTTTNGQLRFEDLGSTEKLRRFYRVIER